MILFYNIITKIQLFAISMGSIESSESSEALPNAGQWVQEVLSGLSGGLFDQLGTWLGNFILDFIKGVFLNIFNWVIQIVLDLATNVFENPLIASWFDVISLLAKLCLFAGTVIYVANIGIKMSTGRRLIVINDLKTFAMYAALGWFGVDFAIKIFTEVNELFKTNIITEPENSLWSDLIIDMGNTMAGGFDATGTVVVQIIIFIIMIICIFSFIFFILKQVVYIFVLISTIPVYMFSFGQGYSSGFFSWLRMFTSATLTYFLQYFLFYLAMSLLISNAFILSILFFSGIPIVPIVLARFGNGTTSFGDILGDVASTAKQSVTLASSTATGGMS